MKKVNDKEKLYDKLVGHNDNNVYPMHMPGHKRNTMLMNMINPYAIDITEIDEFDNMHNPKGVIKNIEDRANNLYGAKKTWLSVNGSSIGLMAAICAVTNRGDSILIGRNSHKSIYNAIELNELNPEYIYPEYIGNGINGQIFLTDIMKKIENNSKICAVVVTSPTYEGVISDITGISQYLHSKEIPLIVDAAHGAHLGFATGFPKNAIKCGADIVVHSIHKTLPAFTQTSLLHVVSDKFVDINRVNKYMSIFQSSSPSYILMSGIEKCIDIMEQSEELFKNYNNYLDNFYEEAAKLNNIYLLDYKHGNNIWRDRSKIVICNKCEDNKNYGGMYIYTQLLKRYNIQLEMKSASYALAMTSICDTKEGFDRLLMALVNIDKDMDEIGMKIKENLDKIVGNCVDNVDNCNVEKSRIYADWDDLPIAFKSYTHYPPYKIQKLLITSVLLKDSVDKISAEYVYLYPPDIPLIVPGEIITQKFINIINEYKRRGFGIEGLQDEKLNYIKVVNNEIGEI